eukprot:CAMPEP_0196580914 /NCGR_PEP_ID=MMETSP1081-20130531/31478_1 /TAXON_ID=36882 /ORGANISM="Pyramimonas amylifera, Strain CCMP720" /LENGTH=369 /DNA_ID=CAMNT_0041900947 /DNA_START=72 /DNA_END=1181 /DNA_ORIENTATION=+
MLKVKQYDYKDSNVAGIGSALDKACREAAANLEPAWENAGIEEGLRVWRMEKFQVVEWEREDYGKFFDGDAYIVLHTYKNKDSPALHRDVHFWLGCDCSQDEAGTAAYKTVELDDKLGGEPVQHREVMGFESALFLSYFPPSIRIMQGGIESGFRKAPSPEQYKPKLMRIRQRGNKMTTFEVPMHNGALNQGDVYILDLGLHLMQWQGAQSSGMERNRAGAIVYAINSERKGKVNVEVLDGDEENTEFHAQLEGARSEVLSKEQADEIMAAQDPDKNFQKCMFKLSDKSGEMSFDKVDIQPPSSEDVFVLDNGTEVFVWIGKTASPEERKMAVAHAQKYLVDHNRPPYMPVTCMREGHETSHFLKAISC